MDFHDICFYLFFIMGLWVAPLAYHPSRGSCNIPYHLASHSSTAGNEAS